VTSPVILGAMPDGRNYPRGSPGKVIYSLASLFMIGERQEKKIPAAKLIRLLVV
jgi:hypothetical protein